MDAALVAAAQALSRGDPLQALKRVALRSDAPALALRATALAQLGEYKPAHQLLRRAARSFARKDRVAAARCLVAQAEIALAARELTLDDALLASAIDTLTQAGDLRNARYAGLLRVRHALSLGELERAEQRLSALVLRGAEPVLRTLAWLAEAEIALRRVRPQVAQRALARARKAARRAQIPALEAEVEEAGQALARPLARLITAGRAEPLSIVQLSATLRGSRLIVDACRRVIARGGLSVSFHTRPVLFELARLLAEAAPREVTRAQLIRSAFGIARESASLRARLRVSMARLRKLLTGLSQLRATRAGFALSPGTSVCVIAPPLDDQVSSLVALLSDGQGWSSSALALALGASQRSVQRALAELEAAGKVRSLGRGRSRRWLAPPLSGFAPHLLLPGASRPG
jgi:tetratricopeptide (TPR) repeat protein